MLAVLEPCGSFYFYFKIYKVFVCTSLFRAVQRHSYSRRFFFVRYIDNVNFLIPISRYIAEALVLYILFKYAYRSRRYEIPLDEKTRDQLIKDFKPEDIVDEKFPVENLNKMPDFFISSYHDDTKNSETSFIKYECADYDMFNLRFKNKTEIIDVIRNYGIGTCGPPGFYGTLDLHLELEKNIADYLGVQSSILYSNNFTCINSVITCFCKHYDIIFYNEKCNEAILRAVGITKGSSISWKNLDDLETKIKKYYERKKRNFIITEGLFKNTGEITDLPRLISIKNKHKLRLIIDESLSIPMLGKGGISEYFRTSIEEIDVIIGSLAHVFTSCGGFSAGTAYTTDHQRLSAPGYCFSASMPGYLAKNSSCNLSLDLNIQEILTLSKFFFDNFKSKNYKITSDKDSPMIIISSKIFLDDDEKCQEMFTEELLKIRRVKRFLEKKHIRVGVIENPIPSIRIMLKLGMKNSEILDIVNLVVEKID